MTDIRNPVRGNGLKDKGSKERDIPQMRYNMPLAIIRLLSSIRALWPETPGSGHPWFHTAETMAEEGAASGGRALPTRSHIPWPYRPTREVIVSTTDPHRPGRTILVMTPSYHKLVDVVLFLLTLAEEKGQRLTTYQIVKAVFIADRWHLNEYGRPVTFDVYKAMENGPVPSAVYDLLLEVPNTIRKTGPALWKKSPRENPEGCLYEHYAPQRAPDLVNILSDTAVDALTEGFELVNRMDFGTLRDFTHEDPSYKDAWRDGVEAKSFVMDYALLLDRPDPGFVAELAEIAEARAMAGGGR